MKITVCIGSACHLNGSKEVVERLQALVAEKGLKDEIELGGNFCLGKCGKAVNVSMDGKVFEVTPDTVDEFFEDEVLRRHSA